MNNKTRTALRLVAGAVATTALVLGSLGSIGSAQAKKDTGWGVGSQVSARDTGWGAKKDTGWG